MNEQELKITTLSASEDESSLILDLMLANLMAVYSLSLHGYLSTI